MRRWGSCVVAAVLVVAGCTGDDSGEDAQETTTTTDDDSTTTTGDDSTTTTDDDSTTTAGDSSSTTAGSSSGTTSTTRRSGSPPPPSPSPSPSPPPAPTPPPEPAPVPVPPPPAESVDISLSSDISGSGDQRLITFLADNGGFVDGGPLVLTISLPNHVELVSVTGRGGAHCEPSGSTITCTTGDSPPGGQVGGANVTVRSKNVACASPTQVSGTVHSTAPDSNPSNNTAGVTPFCGT